MDTDTRSGEFETLRHDMVEHQLAGRGLADEAVLEAMRTVLREAFVPEGLEEFAYRDAPLPIGEEQTISQPYAVAHMIAALELTPGDRVLDVGTGSGYAAAVASRIAREVHSIERYKALAEEAKERLQQLGYDNIEVRHGDGTLGWPERVPFDAIVVAAAGPRVPEPLLEQLTVGGRLVMPTGERDRSQQLVRLRRMSETDYERESLGGVRFVPLVGAAGFDGPSGDGAGVAVPEAGVTETAAPPSRSEQITRHAEPFASIAKADLDALMERIGEARVVLLGEATHGTAEFYEMRAKITQALIERKGFQVVAAEADWPDAAQIDQYVRGDGREPAEEEPFTRFPTWMWANTEVRDLIEWMRRYNEGRSPEEAPGFYGLDLYGLRASIAAVLHYLEDVDPEAAQVARERYSCLSPWEQDPAAYGRMTVRGRYRECEDEVLDMLQELLEKRLAYTARDGERFFDAAQNARLVASAEQYYRTMYYGSVRSWNLRDEHMFETLKQLLDFRGADAKAVVWAHNSHLGDASATEMGTRGEHNVGQLCREHFGEDVYLVGFGTDRGTVAAASAWNGPMEVKTVRPAHEESYERLMCEAGPERFLLPLRDASPAFRRALQEERLERAIGVIYRPETELQSHYFRASLPRQFDEYIWLDETQAVTPLGPEHTGGMPETFPFGT